jgi:hypothetical protein
MTTVMNLPAPWNSGKPASNWTTGGFLRRAQFYWVSHLRAERPRNRISVTGGTKIFFVLLGTPSLLFSATYLIRYLTIPMPSCEECRIPHPSVASCEKG